MGKVGTWLGKSKGEGNGDGNDVRVVNGDRHGGGGGAGRRKQGKRIKRGGMERGECG